MASPYSTSQSIVADFVTTPPTPSNPHSIISSESESSPAISQQTYLSPHSIIPSSDAGLSSPASSSATTATTITRSPQTVSTGPDHPDSKHHYQTPVIYNAYAANNSNSNLTTVAGSPGLWSQSTDVYYPPPPFQYDDQGMYAKATIQQPQLQQPQQQQQQQQQIFQPQYQQQQQYQQYHQQQQPPSAQSFPMYPVGHPNAATTLSHNINDSDHHKPPTDTTHMEILGSGQQHQPDMNKSKRKKKKKCICFFILFPVIIGIVLGIVFGVILKKNNNDGDKSPNPSTSGSGGSSSTRTTTTATGYYPYPTGMPDMTNCILACQKALTDCTGKCGTNSTCSSECFTTITSCSLGCAGLGQ